MELAVCLLFSVACFFTVHENLRRRIAALNDLMTLYEIAFRDDTVAAVRERLKE